MSEVNLLLCTNCNSMVSRLKTTSNFCARCHKNILNRQSYRRHQPEIRQRINEQNKDPEAKAKRRIKDQQQYEKHKDIKLEQFRQYWINNKEKIMKRRQEYREANTEKIKLQRANQRKKTHNLLKESICRRMNECLKTNDIGSGRWFKYLGCTIDELRDWFAYLFPIIDPNMSFENHGTYWHVDHVRPISSFDLTNEENIHECFSWRNLSPLEKSLNLSKNNKVHEDLIAIHKSRVEHYEKHIKSQNNQTAQTTADL